MIIATSSIEQR